VPFKKDKRRAKDGLGAYCLACQRAYNAEHYAANKVARSQAARDQYAANREAALAWQREYRAANAQRIRDNDRDRYANKPGRREATLQRGRDWSAKNPDEAADHACNSANKLRMQRLGSTAKWEPVSRRTAWNTYGGCCGICGEPVSFEDMQLDHIVPLVFDGPHTQTNVQPAHAVCNGRKGVNERR
jgi:5-methylcytosine-specific restriction endonuclease McrA